MTQWLGTGEIKYREHLVKGLENSPQAFIGLLEGRNFGKLVIRVSDNKWGHHKIDPQEENG